MPVHAAIAKALTGSGTVRRLGPPGRISRHRLDPVFGRKVDQLIAELRAEGIAVTIASTYRSIAKQIELIKRWDAGDPGIVTRPATPGRSFHNYGLAVDLNLDPPEYELMAEIAEELGLRSGIDFDDPVHVDDGRRIAIAMAKRSFNERRLVAV